MKETTRNIIRLIVLGLLIVLCTLLTITLWLGESKPSHYFLKPDNKVYSKNTVATKQIWSNIGSTLYKIKSDSEKNALQEELIAALRSDHIIVEAMPKESYRDILFGSKGMIFEFGLELTVDEIIGQSKDTKLSKKEESIKIKQIYIELKGDHSYKTPIYLVDKTGTIIGKLIIENELKVAENITELYSDTDYTIDEKIYTSSLTNVNDSELFIGNVIYPEDNAKFPVKGNKLKVERIIKEGDEQLLDNYVSDLFKNPSYKTINRMADGIIAYSDNLNISVKYNPIGTLEFTKTFLNYSDNLSEVEKINKVHNFICQSRAIPDTLKAGLYLENIVKEETITRFEFGYRYENGEIVVLTDTSKAQLNLNAFLTITMQSDEIISGKWLMCDMVELEEETSVDIESRTIIEQIYETKKVLFKLSRLECAYLVNDINKSIELGFSYTGE